MTRRHFAGVSAALILAAAFLFCSPAKTAEPEGLLGAIEDFRLPNGMRVVLKERHTSPVVSVQLVVARAGSSFEGSFSGSGISHLVEHMVFLGVEHGTDTDVARSFHELGAEINAYTDKHRTVFTVELDSAHTAQALKLLPPMLFESRFEQTAFDNEKKVIERELAMNADDPERMLADELWALAFLRHPYRHPVGGTLQALRALTIEDAQKYYRRRYTPANMILCIAGDFRAGEMKKTVEEIFGPAPWKPSLETTVEPEPEAAGPREKTFYPEQMQTACVLTSYRICDAYSPDSYALDVIASALGSGKDSILHRELVDGKKLAYAVSCAAYTPDFPGLFLIQAVCAPENVPELNRRIEAALLELSHKGLDKERIAAVKRELVKSKYFSIETAENLAEEIALGTAIFDDPRYAETYLKNIQAVDEAAVRACAEKYFSGARRARVTGLPASHRAADTTPPEEGLAAAPALETLPNGVRLVLRRNTALPVVSVAAVMTGGVLSEAPDQAGISQLLATMLLRGTSSRDAYAQERQIRDLGGALSAFSGYNSLGLTLNVPSDGLEPGLDILADALLRPQFSKTALEQEKQLQIKVLDRVDEDAYQSAMRAFRRAHFGDHPYGRLTLGDRDGIAKIEASDLKRLLGERLSAANFVLSVSGDFDPERVRALAKKYFSALPARYFVPCPTARTMLGGLREAGVEKKFRQSVLVMGFDACALDDPDLFPLKVAEALFSGQSSRLFSSVRGRDGAAYSVGAALMSGTCPGAFLIYAATTRGRVENSRQTVCDLLRELSEGQFAEGEIERAKTRIISEHKIALQTNASVALSTALDEVYGLGCEEPFRFEEKIRAVTAEDLSRVAQKYLRADVCSVTVLSGTEE